MAPFLSKRCDGIYIIRFTDSTTLRRRNKSTGTRLKREALLALAQFRIPGEFEGITVADFARNYLAYSKNEHQASSHQLVQDILKPFLAGVGYLRLDMLTPAFMDEYRAFLSQGRKPATVLIHLRQLKAMFSYAVQRGYILESPMRYMKNLYVKNPHRTYLTPEAFPKLWKALRIKWHRDIVSIALLTGLRRKELVDLLWCDIDLKERLSHVRHGKGDKQRSVPLNDQAINVLNNMDQTTGHVFVTEEGTSPDLHYVSRLFARARERAGLDKSIHFHSLRHSFATLTLKNGASVQDVQRIMGHQNIGTTMDYSHLVSGEMHDTVKKLPQISMEALDSLP